jgi:hypothetical protein
VNEKEILSLESHHALFSATSKNKPLSVAEVAELNPD